MLFIGQTAANKIGLSRRTRDVDVIMPRQQFDALRWPLVNQNPYLRRQVEGLGPVYDIKVADPGSSAWRYLEDADAIIQPKFASLAALYSLKRSHRHRPIAWRKHIDDYHRLKREMIRVYGSDADRMADVTAQREAEYGRQKTPTLASVTPGAFFDNHVSNRHFVHDDIHLAIAHGATPMYVAIQKQAGYVACDQQKWHKLSQLHKVQCVLEEAYVIALERALLPMMYDAGPLATPRAAYEWALMRICTTLTGGWFRDFATEHVPLIDHLFNEDFASIFLAAVQEGRVRRVMR